MLPDAFTVIVCTYNRALSLKRTLESLCAQTGIEGRTWELVIVDNNSKDNTREICEQYTGKLPIRYCFEERRGKSSALNHGISKASYDFLLFTDDDVEVSPDWVMGLVRAGERYPAAAFFCGRLRPKFETTPPRWLSDNGYPFLASLLVWYDPGDREEPVEMALGANMALRRSRLLDTRFDPTLGPDGTETVRGEESLLIKALTSRGESGVYVPDAIAYHWTPNHRMTRRYLWKWFYGEGLTRARCGQIDTGNHCFGVPRYLVREAIVKAAACAIGLASAKNRVWVRAFAEFAQTCGAITELSRLHRFRSPSKN